MNEITENRHGNQKAQLPSLIAGELSPLRAFLLRRHLSRCPECARELTEMTALWGELKALQAIPTAKPAPAWPVADAPVKRPDPMFTLGGLTMKRRTAFAVCAALTLTLTGAVAARQWFAYGARAVIGDRQGHNWDISTKRPVRVTIYDNANRLAGVFRNDDGGPASGPVTVRVAGTQSVFDKLGRHAVKDAKGSLLGVVEIAPLNDNDRAEMDKAFQQYLDDLAPLYNRDFAFPIRDGGANGKSGSFGVVTSYDASAGIAYKALGYVQVQETSASGVISGVSSGAFPTEDTLRTLRPEVQKMTQYMKSLAPPVGASPEIYITFAAKDAAGKYALKDGWWSAVRRTVRLMGYGSHVVKDEAGKVVLTLNVQPLESQMPAAKARR